MKFATLFALVAAVSAVQLEASFVSMDNSADNAQDFVKESFASKPAGKKSKKTGEEGKVANSITGTAPSGQIAKGYDAPEQVLQPDAKLAKFGTTFY